MNSKRLMALPSLFFTVMGQLGCELKRYIKTGIKKVINKTISYVNIRSIVTTGFPLTDVYYVCTPHST